MVSRVVHGAVGLPTGTGGGRGVVQWQQGRGHGGARAGRGQQVAGMRAGAGAQQVADGVEGAVQGQQREVGVLENSRMAGCTEVPTTRVAEGRGCK